MFIRELKKFKKELDDYNELIEKPIRINHANFSWYWLLNILNEKEEDELGLSNLTFKPLCWSSGDHTYINIYRNEMRGGLTGNQIMIDYEVLYKDQFGEDGSLEIKYLDKYQLCVIYKYLCEKFKKEFPIECKNFIVQVDRFREIEKRFEGKYKNNVVKLLTNLFDRLSKSDLDDDDLNNLDLMPDFPYIEHPDCDGNDYLVSIFNEGKGWELFFGDDSSAPLKDWDIKLLIEIYYKFISYFITYLNKNAFIKMNEMESKPAETRLNYFKNFNHINKDQLGAMEIFGSRSNNEIQRMNDETFDDGNDYDENEIEEVELPFEYGEDEYDYDYPQDQEDGLEIGGGTTIQRFHSYPYGFGSPPSPTFRIGNNIKSTYSPVLTFEKFNQKK
jgi:hypothetical protein